MGGDADEAGQGPALLEDGDGVEAERDGHAGGRDDAGVVLEERAAALGSLVAELDGEREALLVLVAYCVGSTA